MDDSHRLCPRLHYPLSRLSPLHPRLVNVLWLVQLHMGLTGCLQWCHVCHHLLWRWRWRKVKRKRRGNEVRFSKFLFEHLLPDIKMSALAHKRNVSLKMLRLVAATLTVLQLTSLGVSSRMVPTNPTTKLPLSAKVQLKLFDPYSLSKKGKNFWNASSLFTLYSDCLPPYRQVDCYPAYPQLSAQERSKKVMAKNLVQKVDIEVFDPKEYCAGTFDFATCLIDIACSHCNFSVVTAFERFCMAAFRADDDTRYCKKYLQMNDILGRCTGRAIRGLLFAEVLITVIVIVALNCIICACFCCLTCREDGYEVEDREQVQVVHKNVFIDEEE